MNQALRSAIIRTYAEEIFGERLYRRNLAEFSITIKGYETARTGFGFLKKAYFKSIFHDLQNVLTSPLG